MGIITDQLNTFWAAKLQTDKIITARAQIQGSLNQLEGSLSQVKASIDAGVLEGLSPESRTALEKAYQFMSDCLAGLQADTNIQELLNWIPTQG